MKIQTKPTWASRTNWDLSTNRISEKCEKLKRQNISFIDLSESNPTRCHFNFPQQDILEPLIEEQNMRYHPLSKGMIGAREAICDYYKEKGIKVSSDKIILTSSTSEAYSLLFRLLVNPGERVLFPAPSYPLFQFLGDLNDVTIDTYSLLYQGRWQPKKRDLDVLITEETKAVVLVNPNNPTGSYIKSAELDRLNDLCGEKGIPLISDEVFWDYSLDGVAKHICLADNQENLTFTLGGISKSLCLPQMKLSWILVSGPDEDVQASLRRLEVIVDTYLSVNTPAQAALKKWMTLRMQIQEKVLIRLRDNYNFLKGACEKLESVEVPVVEGGWYGILRSSSLQNEEEFVLDLLENERVFVHPGYFFDFPEKGYLVLSLLTSGSAFRDGLEKILTRMKSII